MTSVSTFYEAVAVGLVLAAHLSNLFNGFSKKSVDKIKALLLNFNLPVQLPDDLAYNDLLSFIERDKKNSVGKLHFILLKTIGSAFLSDSVTKKQLQQVLMDV